MMTVVSLFSGCGGLDLGFQSEGFSVEYACDSDPAAISCYIRNVDERAFVRDVTSEAFHSDIRALGHIDVVLGGFPCQGFSKAGPKRSNDPRNVLYAEMKRAVETIQPKAFVAENVDGLSQNYGGEYLDRIAREFAELGYEVSHRILQAAAFGVPQFRRRILFIGFRGDRRDAFSWPSPAHHVQSRNGEFYVDELDDVSPQLRLWGQQPEHNAGASLPPPRTIRDAIGDLLELSDEVPDHRVINGWPKKYEYIFRAIREGQKLCNVRHAPTSVYAWQIPEAFGEVDDDERLVLETISQNRRHKRYGTVPNGNPLSVDVIEQLSDLRNVGVIVASLLKKKYLKEIDGRYDLLGAMFCSGLFKRPRWDEPAPTVLTVFDNPRYFLHPLRDRPFSARECARLQGFPDHFVFCRSNDPTVTLKDAYRLIGNAVPPPLAAAIARSVRASLAVRSHTIARAAS